MGEPAEPQASTEVHEAHEQTQPDLSDPFQPQGVSLVNFDENAQRLTFTSPRSIEACKREGIEPQELLKGLVLFCVGTA